MTSSKDHPDLLALLERRLSPELKSEAREHLTSCDQCSDEMTALRAIAQITGQIKDEVPAKDLADLFDSFMSTQRLDPELIEEEVEIPFEELAEKLPPALAQRLKEVSGQEGLAARLRKSIQAVTGKGAGAAKAMAEGILSGGTAPDAAPAIREDATEVEEPENESVDDEAQDPETSKD